MVYDSICQVLSHQAVDWGQFGAEEWRLLPEMAQIEGVGPLLYWHFNNSTWPLGIPKETAATLTGHYYVTRERNRQLFAELDRILAAFETAGIEVILLKGAALVPTVYAELADKRWLSSAAYRNQDLAMLGFETSEKSNSLYPSVCSGQRSTGAEGLALALRPMGDLDLLVRKADVDQAVAIVKQFGYRNYDVERLPGFDHEFVHHTRLINDQTDHMVEIHWNLVAGDADERSPSIEWFWSQTEQRPEWAAQILNPTATWLYVAAHNLLQHGAAESRLIWFYDLHLLVTQAGKDIEWEIVISQAQKFGWLSAFQLAGTRLRQWFQTPIPDWVVVAMEQDQFEQASPPQNSSHRDLANFSGLAGRKPVGIRFRDHFSSPGLSAGALSPQSAVAMAGAVSVAMVGYGGGGVAHNLGALDDQFLI